VLIQSTVRLPAILACLACVFSAGPAYAEEARHPILSFPVQVEDATTTVAEHVEKPTVIYQQTIRLKGAAITKADFKVRAEATKRSGILDDHPGPYDVVIPSGTILVEAGWNGSIVYCTSKTLKSGFWGYYDAGFCLRDTNNDGRFDLIFVTDQYPQRLYSPLNISKLKDEPPVATDVSYEKLEAANVPTVTLHVVASTVSSMLGRHPSFVLSLCSPSSLGVPKDGEDAKPYCNRMDWKAEGGIPATTRYENPMGYNAFPSEGEQDCLVLGPIAVSFKMLPDSTLEANVTHTLESGTALLARVGEMWFGNDHQDSIEIMHIVRPSEIKSRASSSAPPSE